MGQRRKVLLLHGSRQTGDLLLGRMHKLRKRLERQDLEIVAPTAQFDHPEDENMRQWWTRKGNSYEGLLEESMPQLAELWDENFVGVVGFSQGARLAHLCVLAHSANQTFMPGLKFVIMVAGYEAPLPTDFAQSHLNTAPERVSSGQWDGFVGVPSLHVWGSADKLITPDQSRAVTAYYSNFRVHEHEGGHHVPMKAASIAEYEQMIEDALSTTRPIFQDSASASFPSAATPETPATPDEETSQMQQDEVEALTAIYPQEFHLLSNTSENESGEVVYQHPIRYRMDLIAADEDIHDLEGVWPPHPIAIQVVYPHNYPQDALPLFQLVHENNMLQFSLAQAAALVKSMQDAGRAEEGIPCVMSCYTAAREFFESGDMAAITAFVPSQTDPKPDSAEEDIGSEHVDSGTDGNGQLQASSRERIGQCNLEGLEIARSVMDQMGLLLSQGNSNENVEYGKGGHWTYNIGLVGKPSAGKSTFFNAATAFARQRDDSDNLLGGASMAPHPFTTIDPNVGFCLVPAPNGSCPEDTTDHVWHLKDKSVGCTHGRDHKGRRLLPVLLKDVAGLVPGAYQGRGRGNKFLNDLTDANVLIHVLDASGTADTEGNDMGMDIDTGMASTEASKPLNDMTWIRTELVEWVFSNLMFKWDTVKRRGRSKLAGMFGGYGQNQATTSNVLSFVEKFMETHEGKERALDHLELWDEGDVHRLVSAFLGVRFPMVLALNKYDLPTSAPNVAEIQQALPIHGAHDATPVCARSEMNFIRYHIEQALCLPGATVKRKDETDDRQLPEGVWECLQSALRLQEPVLVFPVADLATYAPLPGFFKYATSDPSLPNTGMIRCLETAGGRAPSLWNPQTLSYANNPADSNKPESVVLRDALIMKPGSTVDDVFMTLKRLGALAGEFVRAEATGNIGAPSRPVPKTQRMERGNRIVKIMTSKRSGWQNK
mmetsp:Transcript_18178/g.42934  ORF Transcript_18178/g.42934 Transcript_18178/m.42934 type:complete len:942 (+) Transcript_18178:73-2898(+)